MVEKRNITEIFSFLIGTMASEVDNYEKAPIYTVPTRRLGALEHPMIIKDVDKGIKTFGQNFALEAVRGPLLFCRQAFAYRFFRFSTQQVHKSPSPSIYATTTQQ